MLDNFPFNNKYDVFADIGGEFSFLAMRSRFREILSRLRLFEGRRIRAHHLDQFVIGLIPEPVDDAVPLAH